MAVVSLKTPWRNGDGMNVYWPGDAGTVTRGGEVDFDGRHETFVEIDLTKLPAFGTDTQIVAENVSIPKGAMIDHVELFTTKAATGATATLSVGLVQLSDRTTILDTAALINAATVASIATLGTEIEYRVGSTGAGTKIGTQLTTDAYLITAQAGTANFTAGKVQVRVRWFVPNSVDL